MNTASQVTSVRHLAPARLAAAKLFFLGAACVAPSLAHAQDGSFYYIGSLGGHGQEVATPTAIAPGPIVYGFNNYYDAPTFRRAFTWTPAAGMLPLANTAPSVTSSGAYAVSADGSVLVGVLGMNPGSSGTNPSVFRRVNGGANETLPLDIGMTYPQVMDISDDGNVTVGSVNGFGGGGGAVRWIGTNVAQLLPRLPDAPTAVATAVNADGSVIVGWSGRGYPYDSTPVRWVNGQIESMGMPPGSAWSNATGVSADGTIIVGRAEFRGASYRPFRWTAEEGYTYLSNNNSLYASATAISADGRLISGHAGSDSVIWRDGVLYIVSTQLLPIGTDILPFTMLSGSATISRDGKCIASADRVVEGPGDVDYHAWAVTLPEWFTCLPPKVSGQSDDVSMCSSGAANLTVSANGGGVLTYQWTVESPANSGEFVDLGPGQFVDSQSGLMFDTSGVDGSTLTVSGVQLNGHAGPIRLVARIASDCDPSVATSTPISLTICAADYNCDVSVDFFDYLDFVDAFSGGSNSADFNHDTVIDFFDYLDFVDAFSLGC